MDNEIISYDEMCSREGAKLQRGMNFKLGGDYSVFLMSTRKGSPSQEEVTEDGAVLIYEGHDVAKTDPFMVPIVMCMRRSYVVVTSTLKRRCNHAIA
jgi:hypothetical protein